VDLQADLPPVWRQLIHRLSIPPTDGDPPVASGKPNSQNRFNATFAVVSATPHPRPQSSIAPGTSYHHLAQKCALGRREIRMTTHLHPEEDEPAAP
jgi:hypothetical protein